MFILAQSGFFVLTILCLLAVDKVFFPAKLEHDKKSLYRKRFWMGTATWLLIVSALSLSGFLSDFSGFPPRMMIILLVPLVVFFLIYFNRSFSAYLDHIPLPHVILLQSFRLPVELLLWLLFLDGSLPVQMTFEGLNLDVLTGLTAPLIVYLLYKRAELATSLGVVWNLGGFLLLVNIVSIALLSMPTPIRHFMNEPSNTVVALFPIVYLPAILVPMAYYLHWLSWKQIRRRANDEKSMA